MQVSKEKAAVVVARDADTCTRVFETNMFLEVAGPWRADGGTITEEDALKIVLGKANQGVELTREFTSKADLFWIVVDEYFHKLLNNKVKTSPIVGPIVFAKYDADTKKVIKLGYLR